MGEIKSKLDCSVYNTIKDSFPSLLAFQGVHSYMPSLVMIPNPINTDKRNKMSALTLLICLVVKTMAWFILIWVTKQSNVKLKTYFSETQSGNV